MTMPPAIPDKPPLLIRLWWALCDVYAVGVLAFLAARLVFGESWAMIALLNNLTPWALLPALALAGLALARRRWRRLALYGALAAIFFALYGELFLPSLRPAPACAAESPGCAVKLRVMQFNLYNDNIDLARLIPLLRDSGADIAVFEEFSQRPAAAIKAQLSDVYPYQVQYGDGIPGVGLISKYPIVSAETFTIESPFLFHLKVTLDINGSPLRVIVAHPDPPAFDRSERIPRYVVRSSADVRALARMATTGEPTLLVGDFNTVDQSEDYRAVRDAGLRDAFREAGWGLGVTWPMRLSVPPLVRIDYIWMTPDFVATNAWVGPEAGSDHLPVLADLVWTP